MQIQFEPDTFALIGAKLRLLLLVACTEDEISLSHAAKEAIKRWLASRERKGQRARKTIRRTEPE